MGSESAAWLPEDRDVVAEWQVLQGQRHEPCGRFPWEWSDDILDDYTVDYEVCQFCFHIGEGVDETIPKRKHMHGVRFGFYPLEVPGGD